MKKLSVTLHESPGRKMALFFAGALFWMAAVTIFGRLDVEANGQIIESQSGTGARRSTWYKVQQADGSFQTLVAGWTDASLPRTLVPGTVIEKRRWEIGYTVDHQYRLGFPVYFYGSVLVVSAVLFFSSFRFHFT
jgi:hypothetical protein